MDSSDTHSVPFRGYGSTTFLSGSTPRNGQREVLP